MLIGMETIKAMLINFQVEMRTLLETGPETIPVSSGKEFVLMS